MMTATVRVAGCAALLLSLAACVGPRVRPQQADPASLARQSARERALAMHPDWALHGRLGVSDGHDSGSGSLQWSQRGDAFRFSVHAPVTGKTWVLQGRDGRVVLEGLREQPVEGEDAAALLERELGWRVPVAELVDWARGARAQGPARVTFRADGLPATIEQAGWRVEYLDYDESREPPLPRKVFASHGDYKVRLAIREWTLDAAR